MTLSKLYKMGILFGIIAMFFAFTPAATMAGGGPEPGAGCAFEGAKYVAPPFIGDVTLTHNAVKSEIDILGTVSQAGNPECEMVIDSPGCIGGVSVNDYKNLRASNLRQRCLESEIDFSLTGCDSEFMSILYFESVGAGNLRYDELTESYTAHVVIMGLQ